MSRVLFQSVGCVGNKSQFRTVQQNQKSFPWMLDWDWRVCPLWNYRIWLFLFLEIVLVFQIERGNLWMVKTNTTSLRIKSMWCKTLILFLQMANLRVKKLYCMCYQFKERRIEICGGCQMYALKIYWNVCVWHALVDMIFFGQSTNLHVHTQSGPELAINIQHIWSPTFISRVSTKNVVMWEILPNNTDWDCFKTLILQEILRIQNLLRVEHCAYSDATRLFRQLQDTDVCVTQFNEIWNYFSGCRLTQGRNFCAWSLGFGYWCDAFLLKSKAESQARTGQPFAW